MNDATQNEKPQPPDAPKKVEAEEILARFIHQLLWTVPRERIALTAYRLHRLEDADFDRDLIAWARRSARVLVESFEVSEG